MNTQLTFVNLCPEESIAQFHGIQHTQLMLHLIRDWQGRYIEIENHMGYYIIYVEREVDPSGAVFVAPGRAHEKWLAIEK